jgi:hypothetical protein
MAPISPIMAPVVEGAVMESAPALGDVQAAQNAPPAVDPVAPAPVDVSLVSERLV